MPSPVKLDLASWNSEQALINKINDLQNPVGLGVWVRDVLVGTPSMANQVIWARESARKLRAEADAIELRAVRRLAEDIIAEWPKDKIHSAIA